MRLERRRQRGVVDSYRNLAGVLIPVLQRARDGALWVDRGALHLVGLHLGQEGGLASSQAWQSNDINISFLPLSHQGWAMDFSCVRGCATEPSVAVVMTMPRKAMRGPRSRAGYSLAVFRSPSGPSAAFTTTG